MKTSIQIRKKTREKLERYKEGDETWDEFINRLMSKALPRQPAGVKELERRREKGEYVRLEKIIEKSEKI